MKCDQKIYPAKEDGPGEDNAPTCSVICASLLGEKGDLTDSHLPHSPDIAQGDFYIFPNMKKEPKGRHFEQKIINATQGIVVVVTKKTYVSNYVFIT